MGVVTRSDCLLRYSSLVMYGMIKRYSRRVDDYSHPRSLGDQYGTVQ